jgi:peptidoglycan/LPS O-acetylase OafA/YrhL
VAQDDGSGASRSMLGRLRKIVCAKRSTITNGLRPRALCCAGAAHSIARRPPSHLDLNRRRWTLDVAPLPLGSWGRAFANLGVRIFFVISGYLITTLLLQEQARSSTIQLRGFYVRRAYRILPAAIAFMLPVFVIYWGELRWYHMAAAALYVTNFDPGHPWFLGHLWSLSVEEQFYFLWPGVLKKWHRHRTAILVGVILFAPVYRFVCHLLKLHGRADETFPAVADVLAIGCLLAIFAARLPRIKTAWALAMVAPVALVPVYVGAVHFRTTAILLLVLWPLLHFSIAGLLLHVVQTPYWILNVKPVVWLGKISYGLYLWQQLFAYNPQHRNWYWLLVPVGLASLSYYLVEQPMLRLRQRREVRERAYAQAASLGCFAIPTAG